MKITSHLKKLVMLFLVTALTVGAVSCDNPTSSINSSSLILGSTFTVKYRSYNPVGCLEGGNYTNICPIRNASVTSSCGNGQTGSNGNFVVTCTGSTISGSIQQYNGRYRMYPSSNLLVPVQDNFNGSGGGDLYVNSWNDTTAYFFNAITLLDSAAIALFSRTPSGVSKVSPRSDAGVEGICGQGIIGGCFDPSSHDLIINHAAFTDTVDFFTEPWLTLSHEMGHSFHDRAIEAITCNYSDALCYSWVEGVADFLAVYVGSAVLQSFSVHNESNGYGLPQYEGISDYHNIASMLTDMADSAGSNDYDNTIDDDTVTWPASYIRDLIQTCSTKFGFIWANTISRPDQFIVCLQRNVSAKNAAPSWDQGNWAAWSQFTESATEPPSWSVDKVKKLWLFNLYGQGTLP